MLLLEGSSPGAVTSKYPCENKPKKFHKPALPLTVYCWGLHQHLNPRPTSTHVTSFAILNLAVTNFTISHTPPLSWEKREGTRQLQTALFYFICSNLTTPALPAGLGFGRQFKVPQPRVRNEPLLIGESVETPAPIIRRKSHFLVTHFHVFCFQATQTGHAFISISNSVLRSLQKSLFLKALSFQGQT